MATILAIEDRPVNLRFVTTLLRDHGHRLLEACDGEEALRIVRAEKPDLVIIDVLTSGMDGCQFVLNLRQEPDSVQPRVVFRAAAYIAAEAEALASSFGAFFVAKPVNPEKLLAQIRNPDECSGGRKCWNELGIGAQRLGDGGGTLVMRGIEFGAAGLVLLFGLGLLFGYLAAERVTCL